MVALATLLCAVEGAAKANEVVENVEEAAALEVSARASPPIKRVFGDWEQPNLPCSLQHEQLFPPGELACRQSLKNGEADGSPCLRF